MGRRIWIAATAFGLLSTGAEMLPAQGQVFANLEARVWLDRGIEPVFHQGDRFRIYYRTNRDAYVAVFHIDTDGAVQLVHPTGPGVSHYARGGRDYRLRLPGSDYWRVSSLTGIGYFFIVASPTPFDFRSIPYASHGGWNLTRVGTHVYRDPFLAMDDYVSYLVPNWEYATYALDFSLYHVDRRYDYPRFLCYDCHLSRRYTSWNPYLHSCTTFRVVIYDDPYFYPRYRYRGTQVVYTRPVRVAQPQFSFKERARGEGSAPLRTARPVAVSGAGASPASGSNPAARSRANAVIDGAGNGATGAIRPGRTVLPSEGATTGRSAQPRSRPTAVLGGSGPGRAGTAGPESGSTARVRPGSTGGGTAQARPSTTTPPRSPTSGVRPSTGQSSSGGVVTRPGASRPPTSAGSSARPPVVSGSGGRPPATAGSTVRPPSSSSAARPPVASSSGSRPPVATSSGSRPPVARPGSGSTGRGGGARPPTVRPGSGRGGGGG